VRLLVCTAGCGESDPLGDPPAAAARASRPRPRRAGCTVALSCGRPRTLVGTIAADPDLPDLDALALKLVQLRHCREELTRRHKRIQDRLSAFPNDFQQAQEQLLADQLAETTARLEALQAQLAPHLRRI